MIHVLQPAEHSRFVYKWSVLSWQCPFPVTNSDLAAAYSTQRLDFHELTSLSDSFFVARTQMKI